MGDLPRIELFARSAAEGWDCWGNEAPGMNTNDGENAETYRIMQDGQIVGLGTRKT